MAANLRADTRFPGGSGRLLEARAEAAETHLAFTAEAKGGHALRWFHLRIFDGAVPKNDPRPTPLPTAQLRLRFADNLRGLDRPELFRPVLRPAGGDWARLPAPRPHALPDGQAELIWDLSELAAPFELAAQFPYAADELETLVEKAKGAAVVETVGLSPAGTALRRVRLPQPQAGPDKPGVYVVARAAAGEQHPGWVLDGLLRAVAGNKQARFPVWAVPFADPDGAHHGAQATRAAHDGLEAAVWARDVRRWAAQHQPALLLILTELDALSAAQAEVRPVAGPETPPETAKQAVAWAQLLRQQLGADAAPEAAPVPPPLPWLAVAPGPAVEVRLPFLLHRDKPLTRNALREIGRHLADALTLRLRER